MKVPPKIFKRLPFRLNLFVQEKINRHGIYLEGMTDKQRGIALNRFFKANPIPDPDYGPPFEPPWVAFPDYPRNSMGFRMGGGEDYIHQFRDWYDAATKDEVTTFKEQFPEPENYLGFYDSWDESRSKTVDP